MRSPRMAPNTFVAPAGKLVQIRPPGALFRFCWLAVDGLMAPARNAVHQKRNAHVRLGSLAPNRLGRDAGGMSALPRRVQLVTATPRVVYRQEFRIPRSSV